ncbi:serine/threonine-protein kinase [Actinomadura flavalba]|uniref:serine/threonine-protein kinase n=1 Tax=Actinomadura flavalba TaxID=1120938 RepID=UPI0003A1ED5E|nr:serine/threonine-protein kinase [Actinomadura flavalba]
MWGVPGYRELTVLGEGAQGRVVLARHEATGRTAAVKYLGPALAGDPAFRERFREEAALLSRLHHPHVARLYGLYEAPGGAAIVMEAVDGASLKAVLAERGPLAPEAALTVLKGSLLGLAAAHGLGIVHRDYKPANVVVRGDGASKLIDFGVAVDAGAAGRAGTPAYMAPEQWRDEPASPATDVYAAACVFYECVTGRRPYPAPSVAALMNDHLTAPLPLEALPDALRDLAARGLAKDPWARPESASAFVAALEETAATAYGADWEQRGVRALATAAAALAALFPLAALTTSLGGGAAASAGAASGAAGAASGAASGAAGTASAGGVLGVVGGKGAAIVAGAAVVAAAGGGAAWVASGDGPERPPALASGVVPLSEPGTPVAMAGQTVRVTGGAPGLAERINAALRAPLDARAAAFRPMLADEPGATTTMTVKPRIELKGPRYLSVRYDVSPSGQQLGHSTWHRARTVTVDLRTGAAVAPERLFTAAWRTADGRRTFVERVLKRAPAYVADCTLGRTPVLPADALTDAQGGVQVALRPAELAVVLDLTALGAATACGQPTAVVPYAELDGLLDPAVVKSAAPVPEPS